jgi:hypothetical protein
VTERYTAEGVLSAITAEEERLFAPWAVGRPEGWKPSKETKDTVCIGLWLREELSKLVGDDDRKTQEAVFYRWSRNRIDLHQLAAEILNDALDGNVEQNQSL